MGPDVRRSDGAVPLDGDGVEAHQPLPNPPQLLVDGPNRTTSHRRARGGGGAGSRTLFNWAFHIVKLASGEKLGCP